MKNILEVIKELEDIYGMLGIAVQSERFFPAT